MFHFCVLSLHGTEVLPGTHYTAVRESFHRRDIGIDFPDTNNQYNCIWGYFQTPDRDPLVNIKHRMDWSLDPCGDSL